jgi:hypothetical protein
MAQTDLQRRASDAVAAWLAKHGRNPGWLVATTGADPGTIGDFLNGLRWPKLSTQGRIEEAIGWAPGTIRKIGFGGDVPDLDGPAPRSASNPVGANVDPGLIAELAEASPETIEAIRAVLRAARKESR